MRFIRHWVAVSLVAASFATPAGAVSFSQLVVFGDSLSDAGNAYAMTGTPLIDGYPRFPPSPPYSGTFSNGPTAAQYLASQFGVTAQLGWPTADTASNNLAVGGARNGTGNYNVEINSPPGLGIAYPALAQTGIQRQVERYATQHPSVPDAPSTLFLLWGGANDMFLGLETRPPAEIGDVIQSAITDLSSDVLALANLGAQHILIPGLPDLGKTPEGLSKDPAVSAYMSQASAEYNMGLDSAIGQISGVLAPAGVRLYEFDTTAFLGRIVANAAAFGFDDTTHSCLYDGGIEALIKGCAGYLYFDRVHPTTAAHQLLAGGFAAAVPEPGTLAMLLLAMPMTLWLARRRRLS